MDPSRLHGTPKTLPKSWPWFADEAITQLVKDRYSPQAGWRGKPFSQADARFFLKGIRDLSALFTEDRHARVGPYLRQPKFRSSYLLYFLPLQAAKFATLFSEHEKTLTRALESALKAGEPFRVLDLGAGPGTASLALLLWLAERPGPIPVIDLEWVDTDAKILEDGRALLEALEKRLPALSGRVRLRLNAMPWWKAVSMRAQPTRLVLLGNVLNESDARDPATLLGELLQRQPEDSAGVLCVEPADRKSSQLLSRIRDALVADFAVVGPCLHREACPLSHSRNWCHFSNPIELPGKWFRSFSIGLGSIREWIKYSYIWLEPGSSPAKTASEFLRVVSDPIDGSGNRFVLLCQPDEVLRHTLRPGQKAFRGDLMRRPAGPLSGASGKFRQARKGRQ